MMNKLIFALSFCLPALVGCGGIGPGDYLVYRIAFQEAQMSEDCFAAGTVPLDEQDDSSSLFSSGTFIFYGGADEKFYLDTGPVTLEGTSSSDSVYRFAGESINVEYSGDMDETKEATTVSTVIDFTIDDETVKGVVEQQTGYVCEGPDCPDPANTSCGQTIPFNGSQIEDVELRHDV